MVKSSWSDHIRQPGALPVLPEALIHLQQNLYDLDVDIDKLCHILERDAALVAEIIKTINSPLFGVPRNIASVKHAVVMLGLRRVRAIILSQSLRQSLATYNSPGFAAYQWWDRSLLNAVNAAMLSQRAAPDLAEEAYLAALVADIGVLVLARFEPSYQSLLRRFSGRASCDLAAAEREQLGCDHSELASDIFRVWQLPDTVAVSACRHHDPAVLQKKSDFPLPGMVYFASLTTDCVVSRRNDLCEDLRGLATSHYFMNADELRDHVSAALSRYRILARVLGHGDLGVWELPPALAHSA